MADELIEKLKKKHISRLQRGECTIEMGFILSDILANIERICDHCSNIAGCLLEMKNEELGIHEYLKKIKGGDNGTFTELYRSYKEEYTI